MVTNDAGGSDLVETQYVISSLVTMVYLLGALVRQLIGHAGAEGAMGIGLSQVPAPLLGLRSLAALTCIGRKAVHQPALPVPARRSPAAAAMVGTPEEVIERIRYCESRGVDEFSFWVDNSMSHEEERTSLALFVEQIVPASSAQH